MRNRMIACAAGSALMWPIHIAVSWLLSGPLSVIWDVAEAIQHGVGGI